MQPNSTVYHEGTRPTTTQAKSPGPAPSALSALASRFELSLNSEKGMCRTVSPSRETAMTAVRSSRAAQPSMMSKAKLNFSGTSIRKFSRARA